MNKTISKIMVIPVISAIAVLAAACSVVAPAAVSNEILWTIQRGNLTEDITASGNLALAHTEDLSFQITGFKAVSNAAKTGTTMISGYISEVTVEAGDSVKKGQVLAKLDTVDWNEHIADLEDTITTARRQITVKERALAQAQYDMETAQYKLNVTADVKKASDDLSDAQTSLKFAELNLKEAQTINDIAGIKVLTERIKFINEEIIRKQKFLSEVLSGHSPELKADVNSNIRQQNTQIDFAKAKVLDAQLSIEDAQRTVEDKQRDLDEALSAQTAIVAPFDGFITKVNVAGGDQVSRGTIAMQIADPNKFEAEIQVSEKDISLVKVGGQAVVEVDSMPGISLPARIVSIAPTGTVQQGVVNYKVKVELNLNQATGKTQPGAEVKQISAAGASAQAPGLRQGLSITVKIVINQKNNIVLVPNRAISRQGKDNVVKVSKDGVVTSRVIKVGINDWQFSEVIDGLTDGEQLVIKQTTSASPAEGIVTAK